MSKKIKVGVLGLGRIGKMHIMNMLQMGGFEIKRGVDPFLTDELEREMTDLGVLACTKNADDIFNDEEIDAVVICSITSTHSDYIIRAAKKKKAIFCEKPIDNDINRIVEALKVVKEEGVLLELGFVRRFDYNHGHIAKQVRNGKIGSPEMIHVLSRDVEQSPISYLKNSGGIFVDMLIHDFDMARFIMGSEVTEVFATGEALINKEIIEIDDIDSAIVTLRFENGAIGTVIGSRRSGFGYDQRIEILGSEGFLIDENEFEHNVKYFNRDGYIGPKVADGFRSRYNDAFFEELVEFKNAILENRQPIVTGIDGLKSYLIAEAANRSRKSGKFEKVENIII